MIETQNKNFISNEVKNKNTILYIVIAILSLVIIGLLFYISNIKFNIQKINSNVNNQQVNTTVNNKKQEEVLIITDKRCTTCPSIDPLITELKSKVSSLANAKFTQKDFLELKDFVKESGINALPAVVFNSNKIDATLDPYLIPLKNGKYILNIGAQYDPFAEICDNGIDDNEDGKVDCDDDKCKKTLACAPKVDKPKAELYVMSYCPYGTQAQKGYLQVLDKLGKVADVKVKFVDYIMHGSKEGEQNLREYCIQKEQQEKFHDYLKCFLEAGDYKGCLEKNKIDTKKMEACVERTKKEINYDENMADKSRRFPKFDLHTKENKEYGVQGSPSFVLNGVKVDNVGRSAKAYADLICNSFKEKPKECDFDFDSTTYDPNFGFTSNGQAVSGGCGG